MPIAVENLTFVYHRGTPFETAALDNVSLTIDDGQCWAIIGATGSGKSTLIQHLNGLLRPSGGRVLVGGVDVHARRTDRKALRRQVGVVFQYPEQQLFAETVFDDIAFGPRNFGFEPSHVRALVREAAELVGLSQDLMERSPFALSGGQARRVALAGVLAMRPRVLVLDEPMAGLDPQGRAGLSALIRRLHRDEGLTVVLVSHGMDEVAGLADQVLVLHQGRVLMQGTPPEVFARRFELEEIGLGVPAPAHLVGLLRERGWPVRADAVTLDEAVAEILTCMQQGPEGGGVHD